MDLSYDGIVTALPVSRHNLDEELERQASYYHYIGEELAHARMVRRNSRDRVDAVLADIVGRLMEESKTTKTAAELAAKADARYIAARQHYAGASKEEDKWYSLKEAWMQRSYALSNLASLYSEDYFTRDSASGKRKDQHHEARSPRRSRPTIED